jgi:hypothetical protein
MRQFGAKALFAVRRNRGCDRSDRWRKLEPCVRRPRGRRYRVAGDCHLRENGFKVTVNKVAATQAIRTELGIPPTLASCHTGVVDGYWIEGHVPADLIQQVLKERPADIRGIALPGAHIGAPGMEGPNPVTTYDVVAYDKQGEVRVYATREGKTASP